MKRFVLVLLVVSSGFDSMADVFDDILMAMKSSNAKQISGYFNSNVELTVPGSEGVYSKQQAEIILKSFFTQYPPANVTVQHKGASGQGAKYVIAIYESSKSKYRAYIFMKDSGAGFKIHELRFEKE